MPGVTTAYQTGNHAGRPANGAGCILYSCTTHGLVYRDDGTSWSTFLTLGGAAPAAHAASHEDGGSDEIDLTGLTGGGGGGGLTQAYVGYNAIGATPEAGTNQRVIAKQFTLAAAALVPSVEAYVDNGSPASGQVREIGAAMYTDSGGAPSRVIARNHVATDLLMENGSSTAGRWLAVALGIWLPAGTYWMAIQCRDSMRVFKDGSGSDRYYNPGSGWFSDWGFYSPTTTTDRYSIRAPTLS